VIFTTPFRFYRTNALGSGMSPAMPKDCISVPARFTSRTFEKHRNRMTRMSPSSGFELVYGMYLAGIAVSDTRPNAVICDPAVERLMYQVPPR